MDQQRRFDSASQDVPADIQQGEVRSIVKDERMKRVLKRHPQRDEPKVDSVEPGETPPRRSSDQ